MDSYFLSEGRDLINNEFGSDYNTYYSILQLIASGLNHRSDIDGETVEVHVYLFSSETETDLAKAVKTFENGQVVIIKNGIKYNAMGAQL